MDVKGSSASVDSACSLPELELLLVLVLVATCWLTLGICSGSPSLFLISRHDDCFRKLCTHVAKLEIERPFRAFSGIAESNAGWNCLGSTSLISSRF